MSAIIVEVLDFKIERVVHAAMGTSAAEGYPGLNALSLMIKPVQAPAVGVALIVVSRIVSVFGRPFGTRAAAAAKRQW
jgi:hypothetical protein